MTGKAGNREFIHILDPDAVPDGERMVYQREGHKDRKRDGDRMEGGKERG